MRCPAVPVSRPQCIEPRSHGVWVKCDIHPRCHDPILFVTPVQLRSHGMGVEQGGGLRPCDIPEPPFQLPGVLPTERTSRILLSTSQEFQKLLTNAVVPPNTRGSMFKTTGLHWAIQACGPPPTHSDVVCRGFDHLKVEFPAWKVQV